MISLKYAESAHHLSMHFLNSTVSRFLSVCYVEREKGKLILCVFEELQPHSPLLL